MATDLLKGVYGKLPAHGDFVQRNLPADVVSIWDEWLQHFIASPREQMGDAWLDIYLTSPIWRFVFSPGVLDANSWAGVLVPSVDRVGRYYPFTILVKNSNSFNPLEFMERNQNWFYSLEDLLIDALQNEISVDEILQSLTELKFESDGMYKKEQLKTNDSAQIIKLSEMPENSPSLYPYFLDTVLRKTYSSYSVWSTQGSDRVQPCMMTVQGLPGINGLPAMLDGQWEFWQWNQPYTVNT